MTMKTTIRRVLISALFAVGACGQASQTAASPQPTPAGSLFASAPSQVWRLPDRLREISGLAVSPDGRLFGHDDERAIVYELDISAGVVVKAFTLGATPLAGDFEGLAIGPGGEFWLTTSQGQAFRFGEGDDGEHVAYDTFETGLASVCEVEGLAYANDGLIFACKHNAAREMRNTIALYVWRPGTAPRLWHSLPEAELAAGAGVQHFRPSSLDFDRRSDRLILLSARDGALAELSGDGALLAARALGSGHVQAEGVAVLADGDLAVADEAGDARALLSRYPRVQ